LMSSEQQAFLDRNGLAIKSLGEREFSALKDRLVASIQCYNSGIDASRIRQASAQEGAKSFFKVPFEQVTELVRSRRVFLHKGEAYVPYNQIAPLVVGHFKKELQKALQITAKSWVHIAATEESMRLAPIIQSLSKQYLGPDYTDSSSVASTRATIGDLPGLAKSHFPLCMKHLYGQLQENHHLKHLGRMQFGLFLKGIGLPLEEALQFWKQAFSRKVPGDKFDKQYAYNIRHNYGKEGKRADYTPYTCMKVISSTPGAGEHHGCPYKTFSEANLRSQLQQLQISGGGQKQVLELSKNNHYQLACAKVFELTHDVAAEEGINHPNQFYDLSRQCCSRNEAKMAPATPNNTKDNTKLAGQHMTVTPISMTKTR
jgi:DNA primase large subunit